MMKKKALWIASGMMSTFFIMSTVSVPTFAQSSPNESQNIATGTYEVTIGSQTVTLKDGQKAEIPLIGVNQSDASTGFKMHPNVNFPGPNGTLSLWPENGRLYWNIIYNLPVTSFSGLLGGSDLTSGLSTGYTPVTTFSGNVPTANLSGHTYSAYLNGTAYFLGVPVAQTVPNYIVWTAP